LLHVLDEQSPTNTIILSRVETALGIYDTDEAVPFLASYITNSSSRDRSWVIHVLSGCRLTSNTATAVNALVDCLTNSDVGIVGAASGGLCMPRRFGAQYDFVPIMTNRLATSQDQVLRSNIVVVLGQMGLHWAFGPVLMALNDPGPTVRAAATNAVQRWSQMVVNPSLQADLSRYLQQ
jgi:HEAT repeat protein